VKKEETMQFSVGNKVMHPKFGAGEITGEEHRELVKGFRHYFVIKILATQGTAYVPVRKMIELGVRPVMSRAKLTQVLDTLRGVPRQLSKDYRERQTRIQEELAMARPVPTAKVVRDLTGRKRYAKLTQKDEQLLNRGRELLAAEMALATDVRIPDAQEAIDAALEFALASEAKEPERTQTVDAAPTPTTETLAHKLFAVVVKS
jgi:CarD family transcriptional regulator